MDREKGFFLFHSFAWSNLGRLAVFARYSTPSKMMTGKKNIIANAVLSAVSMLVIFPIIYMSFDRSPCLTFVNESKIVPDAVKPGSDASIQWRVIENRECDGVVANRIILGSDGSVHPIGPPVPTILRHLRKGPVSSSRDITIPLGVPKGIAVYQATVNRWAVYDVFGFHFPNFVQKWWFPMVDVRPPVQFTVI